MLDRLEAALERERAFVDDASHELRTPLALHKTELELALRYAEDAGGDARRDRLGDRRGRPADRSSPRTCSSWRAREEGKLALAPAAGRRRATCSATCASASRARIGEAGRSLVVEPADGLTVDGDRLRLEQALTNLVDNALEHGGGEITVRAARVGRRAWRSTSRTAGPGSRPSSSTAPSSASAAPIPARGGDGTGLGLAIVEAIARAHGAAPTPPTATGGGADVWIALPPIVLADCAFTADSSGISVEPVGQ